MASNRPMTRVIAERRFESSGEFYVQIGEPAPDPTPRGDWYCPVRTVTPDGEKVIGLCGVDAVPVLQFALGLLDLVMKERLGGRKVTWLGGDDLGLVPPTYPG